MRDTLIVLIAIAGVATIVAAFLPWMHFFGNSISLWDLRNQEEGEALSYILMLYMGIVIATIVAVVRAAARGTSRFETLICIAGFATFVFRMRDGYGTLEPSAYGEMIALLAAAVGLLLSILALAVPGKPKLGDSGAAHVDESAS